MTNQTLQHITAAALTLFIACSAWLIEQDHRDRSFAAMRPLLDYFSNAELTPQGPLQGIR